MSAVTETVPQTAMELFQMLPEGTRCELIGNEIYMSPAPRINHQRLILKLSRLIEDNLKNGGEVFISPVDVYIRYEPPIVLQPDIVVVRNENMDIVKEDAMHGIPDVVIEILSADVNRDLVKKKKVYQAAGIEEYFVIDPATLETRCWTLGGKEIYGAEEYVGHGYFNSRILAIAFEFNM